MKLLASFILVLLPVLGLLIYGYQEENERRIDTFLDTQMQTAEAVASSVDSNFDEAFALAWALTNDPVVQTLDPSQIDPHLQRLAPQYPQFEAFGVTSTAGDVVGISLPIPPGAPRPGNASDRPAFKQVIATGQPVVSELLISRATLRPSVSQYVPLRDEQGRLIGAVGVAPYLDAFSKEVESVTLGPEQIVLLVDTNGTVAHHTGLPELPAQLRKVGDFEPVKAALDGRPTKVRRFVSPLSGDVRLGAFTRTPKYGWVVGVSVREDVALAPVRAALRDQLLGFGAIAILSLALVVVASRALLLPISRLTSHALALGRGDICQPVNIKTGDELEKLGQTFDEMAQRLATTLGDLRNSEELYRTLAEAARDMIFVLSREGRIEYVNTFAASQFGARPDEIIGKRPNELFPREVSEAQERNLQKVFQTNQPVYVEEKTKFGDHHEVWLGTWLVPIETQTGVARAVMGISRDITERKELDHLKDQFIAIAAHELKTPLAIMKGYAQALLRPAEETSVRQRKMLEAIDRGSGRMDAVVKDLLDISKLTGGPLDLEIVPVDLSALVSSCIDRVSLIDTRHRVREVSATKVMVQGDRERLEQVVMHLLENAIKYSPAGGDIDVALAVSDHEAVVSVSDHGVGIPGDKQTHIFQRFYSAHTGTPYDYGGMGVGLYISQEIVARHGGRMWFESEEDKGSTFYFSLPLEGATMQSS